MKYNKPILRLTFIRKQATASVLWLLGLLAFAPHAGMLTLTFAQQTVTSATLSGRVVDTDGACVCGARITVINTEIRRKETAITNEEGGYKLSYLPVGNYQLVAECSGFATVNQPLTLTVGQALDVLYTVYTVCTLSAPLCLSCGRHSQQSQLTSAFRKHRQCRARVCRAPS